MPDQLLTGADIAALLREVAEAVEGSERSTVLVVGGSLMALHGLRDSTQDVDSVRPLSDGAAAAIAIVAARHGLTTSWLNDRARPFAPQTLREQDCDVLLDNPNLLVLGAPHAPEDEYLASYVAGVTGSS